MKTESIKLNNGRMMPAVGLGTFQVSNEEELAAALDEALKLGYRHIDTAYLYNNEKFIGNVLERWISSGKIKREELFISTKLPMIGMTPEKVSHFLKLSLTALKLDYVDLYMVHSPVGCHYKDDATLMPIKEGKMDLDMKTNLEAVWKAMERTVDAGLAKSIGLSNYNISQVERMLKCARIPPVYLQSEVHAYFQQKPLQEYCKKNDVVICAFAPLGSPGRKALYERLGRSFEPLGLMEDPVVNKVADKVGKTPAQVLLRFLLQQGIAVIPKSMNPTRLKQNFDVFDFTIPDEDMEALMQLDKGPEGRSFSGKNFFGMEEHPEYAHNEY